MTSTRCLKLLSAPSNPRCPSIRRTGGQPSLPRPTAATLYGLSQKCSVLCLVASGAASESQQDKGRSLEDLIKELGHPLPSKAYQQPLDSSKLEELRALANKLGCDNRLVIVQMGRRGITSSFLCDCMNALTAREIIRVKMGAGSGMDRQEAIDLLTALLDCVFLRAVGYTFDLYRSKTLPRPSNIPAQVPKPLA